MCIGQTSPLATHKLWKNAVISQYTRLLTFRLYPKNFCEEFYFLLVFYILLPKSSVAPFGDGLSVSDKMLVYWRCDIPVACDILLRN